MPSELLGVINPVDPRAVATTIKTIGELLGMDRLRARITAAEQAGSTRSCTIQVVDRRGQAVRARCLVRFYITTTAQGEPAGTQAVGFTGGSVRDTHEPDREYTVLSTANGLVTFDLEAEGVRHILATVGAGDFQTSGPIDFA